MIEQHCDFRSVSFVFCSSRIDLLGEEKTHLGRATAVAWSAELTAQTGRKEANKKRSPKRYLGSVASVSCPVATFHSDGVQTNDGEKIGRRRLLRRVS